MDNHKNLLNIILVTAGSRGQRLLFRYPFDDGKCSTEESPSEDENSFTYQKESRFAVFSGKHVEQHKKTEKSIINNGKLFGHPDSLIANILTPKPSLCDVSYELKIDNITLVGYPMVVTGDEGSFCLLRKRKGKFVEDDVSLKLFNIVVVLRDVSSTMTQMYSSFCKILSIALKHEERRCGYLSKERKLMVDIQDEVASLPEENARNPFESILAKSSLAISLQTAYDSLCRSGEVNLYLNKWLNISFCLPTAYLDNQTMTISETFHACWSRSRPYHSLLFLQTDKEILSSLPIDCSPSLIRMVKMCHPMKSFQTLSQDSDISLTQIFHFASHLVYWGKAMLIYPLAETNVYVLAQDTPTEIDSKIAEDFVALFPHVSLHDCLARFSFPTTLSEHRNPLANKQQQREQVEIVTWLLKKRLLKQLHTYIYLMPPDRSDTKLIHSEIFFDDIISFGGNCTQDSFEKLTPFEQEAVLNMQNYVDKDDMQCFLKVCPYFRGQHHLEDIMYFENIMRSELLALIDKFRSLLVTAQHEDPATSFKF